MSMHWKNIAIILIFVCAVTLPFVGKPIHIDDFAYCSLAKIISENPQNLFTGKTLWLGKEFVVNACPHPPFLGFFIALIMKIFGDKAIATYQACFIIFPVIMSISCYFMGIRFGVSPLYCALLSIAPPMVLVLAHHLMADLPSAAFWAASTTVFINACDKNNKVLFFASGVFATLALMTAYQAMMLVGLLSIFYIMSNSSWRSFSIFLIPIVLIFGMWLSVSYVYTGSLNIFHAYKSVGAVVSTPWYNRFLSAAFNVGGTIFFPLCLLYLLIKKRIDTVLYMAFVLATLFFIPVAVSHCSVDQKIFFIFVTSIGIYFVFSWIKLFWNRVIKFEGTHQGLCKHLNFNKKKYCWHEIFNAQYFESKRLLILNLLWIGGVLFYNIFIMPFGNPRYLLPIIPPVIVTTLMLVKQRFSEEKKRQMFIILLFLSTMALSLCIAKADLIWANTYKDFAETFAQKYKHYRGKIYFAGEFGLRYYFNQKGYTYLTKNNQKLKPGDIIVYVSYNGPALSTYLNDRYYGNIEEIKTVQYDSNFPLRLISHQPSTGFYCSGVGILSFCFSHSPVEVFHVYRVK